MKSMSCKPTILSIPCCRVGFFAMSSATKDVVTLRRGTLKIFDMMLKIEIEIPAEANSKGPIAKSRYRI